MELDYPDSMYYLIVSMRLRPIKRNPCLKEETHYQQGIELLLTMGLTLQNRPSSTNHPEPRFPVSQAYYLYLYSPSACLEPRLLVKEYPPINKD